MQNSSAPTRSKEALEDRRFEAFDVDGHEVDVVEAGLVEHVVDGAWGAHRGPSRSATCPWTRRSPCLDAVEDGGAATRPGDGGADVRPWRRNQRNNRILSASASTFTSARLRRAFVLTRPEGGRHRCRARSRSWPLKNAVTKVSPPNWL